MSGPNRSTGRPVPALPRSWWPRPARRTRTTTRFPGPALCRGRRSPVPGGERAWTVGRLRAALVDLPGDALVIVHVASESDPEAVDDQIITSARYGNVSWGAAVVAVVVASRGGNEHARLLGVGDGAFQHRVGVVGGY
ncbi:DUF6225 family protein [Nonomuraea angiospora]|uniref:DUF6225 family protein n=1 Tax=Nonomuraea angiospora TaxID=46172 RepID=UPI00361029EB